MAKKKLKPIDMATYSRLKRKAHCFNKKHEEEIDRLSDALGKRTIDYMASQDRVHDLEASLKTMVDPGLHEEAKKTSWSQGFHEGQKDKEEQLRKENTCFEKKHKFTEGKSLRNLNFGELLMLYAGLVKDPAFGSFGRISVLVPDNVPITSVLDSQIPEILQTFRVMKTPVPFMTNTKDKKGG